MSLETQTELGEPGAENRTVDTAVGSCHEENAPDSAILSRQDPLREGEGPVLLFTEVQT